MTFFLVIFISILLIKNSKDKRSAHICKLEEHVFQASTDSKTVVVISDASIKNHVTISIAHVPSFINPIIKILHQMINITIIEAELFAIRCGINQAVQMASINHIIVITDSLHAGYRIFDLLVHLYQIQLSVILRELREFFNKSYFNFIKFWDCSSSDHWSLHTTVDKETKNFNLSSLFPCKSLWNSDRKKECDNILNTWKMMFQASNAKGSNF